MFKLPQGACAVILCKEDPTQMLVVDRSVADKVVYSIPGGKRERNESSVTNCVRELFEETGVVVKESDMHPIYCGVCFNKEEPPYWVMTYVTVLDKFPVLCPQEPDMVARFVKISDFETNNAFPEYNQAVLRNLVNML